MLDLLISCRTSLMQLLSIFGAVLMCLLVFCVSWQVLSRYVLQQPSTTTDELARFLLIWLVLVGAAICTAGRRHLAIDLLQTSLGARGKKVLALYVDLMIAAFALGVMVVGGWRITGTSASMGEIAPALQIPMSYVYAILPLSGGLIAIFSLLNFAETLCQILSGKDVSDALPETLS